MKQRNGFVRLVSKTQRNERRPRPRPRPQGGGRAGDRESQELGLGEETDVHDGECGGDGCRQWRWWGGGEGFFFFFAFLVYVNLLLFFFDDLHFS